MTDSKKLDLILEELGNVRADVAELKTDVAELKEDVSQLKEDMIEVKADIVELKEDVAELQINVLQLQTDMIAAQTSITVLHTKVTDIKLVMENEITLNIQRVAEGHLDLDRKLKEALVPNAEVEMLSIKIRMLDKDVKEIQKQLA